MSVLARLLYTPTRRHAVVDSPTRATVHTVCDEREENRIRALLTQALSGPGLGLLDLRVLDADAGASALEATASVIGPAAVPLGRLLTLVWLDPGVHAVRWQLSPDRSPSR
jgi:hypothetical protein